MEIRTLGLYLHIPFCVRKCGYCDFLSGAYDRETRNRYVNALCFQIRESGRRLLEEGRKRNFIYAADTVFLGGGTPSILEAEDMEKILREIKGNFVLLPDAEISMECNPKTADEKKIKGFYRAGINRLSIGLQSSDNGELLTLGRVHTVEDFMVAFSQARAAGFININVDIISAIPGQSTGSFARTLKTVLSLEPEHISVYSLIIEEGTPFYERYKNGNGLPSEEEAAAMDELTIRVMERAGYERYEISNYAKSGFACRHNLKYWSGEEYLGLGIGAASYMRADCGLYASEGETARYVRSRCLNEIFAYLELQEKKNQSSYGMFLSEISGQTLEEEIEEYVFLGLRKTEGISVSEFEARFGRSFASLYGAVADLYLESGLMRWEYDRIYLTDRGLEVSNHILADFLLSA